MEANNAKPAQDPIRILLFSHYFWPESFRINQVAEDLISAGAEVTVLTGFPSYPEGRTYAGYKAWRPLRERQKETGVSREMSQCSGASAQL